MTVPFEVLEPALLQTDRTDVLVGVECYYKRRQDTGLVRIYFRHDGHRHTIDVHPPAEELFKYGAIYDADFSHDPIMFTRRLPAAGSSPTPES